MTSMLGLSDDNIVTVGGYHPEKGNMQEEERKKECRRNWKEYESEKEKAERECRIEKS